MLQRYKDSKKNEYFLKLPRGNNNSPVVLITGDLHGDFRRVQTFCSKYQTTVDDILIILGDAGINYYRDYKDFF